MIILFRVTAKVDMMKMFGSADSNGQMPLMITSQDDKPGLSTYKATDIVADILRRHHWFPHEMTSEKRAQKFHIDDVSLPRRG